MICATHGVETNEVCGEPVCGACYGEALLAERVSTWRKNPTGVIDMTYGLSGHDDHYRPPEET